MPDMEKVIKDLEECLSASCRGFRPRLSCPYNDEEWDIMRDALALLKKQDAVEPFHKCIGNEFSLIEDSHFDYCPYCGKPITWAKQEGR